MHIRVEQTRDIPRIHALTRAAFGSATEATLVDTLRVEAPDVISLVAEANETVVGHIMFSPVRLTGSQHLRAVALAPMAVMPEHQRAGVGSALVRDGLAHCRRNGVEAVFVVGYPAYYPRFGFRPASSFGISCEFDVPDDAFMAVELVAGALEGRTGKVLYHQAFSAL